MEPMKIIIAALSALLICGGMFALVATFVSPGFMDRPVMRRLLIGRLQPTRSNKIIMSIWSILIGSYMMLAMLEQRTLSYIAFAAWLPFAFIVLKRSFQPSAKA